MKQLSSACLTCVYLIYIGTLLTACENELPYTPKNMEPQLIMNALLEAGEEENLIYLNLSGGQSTQLAPEDAKVDLFVNGVWREKGEQITFPDDTPSFYNRSQMYRITTIFHPGDLIRLEATAGEGRFHVVAQVKVPQPIDDMQVDTCSVMLKRGYYWQDCLQYKITLNDRPEEKNYYRLSIQQDITLYGKTDWSERDTIACLSSLPFIINREDVILTDGHVTAGEEEDNSLFNINNKYNIFTDSRFLNSSCTLKVYTESNNRTHFTSGMNTERTVIDYHVYLMSITEADYRYFKALNCAESGDYDEIIMESIIYPTNTQGGLGFVGICSALRKSIRAFDMENSDEPIYQ